MVTLYFSRPVVIDDKSYTELTGEIRHHSQLGATLIHGECEDFFTDHIIERIRIHKAKK